MTVQIFTAEAQRYAEIRRADQNH